MSAETLRRAAALMRERAEANFITPSPWKFAGVDGQGFAVHHGEHDTVALYANRPDAAHIASWHPDVALAVADWLDDTAETWEMCDQDAQFRRGVYNVTVGYAREYAVAVARAYLGEAS